MKKVIFDIHVDIDKDKLDTDLGPYFWDTINRSERTKINFNKYKDKLIQNKQEYADKVGADFFHYTGDMSSYKEYYSMMKEKHPYLTEYLIINFWKHQLMYGLSKVYDVVMYVDFDVIFMTDSDVFEAFDWSAGFHAWAECCKEQATFFMQHEPDKMLHLRGTTNKYFITQGLCMEEMIPNESPIINTGFMVATSDILEKLNFPGELDYTIELINKLKADTDSIFAPNVQEKFDWNNEPMCTFLVQKNEVPFVYMNGPWNECISDTREFYKVEDLKGLKIVHLINKQFDWIWSD